jgi:translation elongation factor EF-G
VQILPTARRVLFACLLTAGPTIMEPVYQADISCPMTDTGGVYATLAQRRGVVVEEVPRVGTPMVSIRAFLPVNMSFGFTQVRRAASRRARACAAGRAVPPLRPLTWLACAGVARCNRRQGVPAVLV